MIFHPLKIESEKPNCFNNPFYYEPNEWSLAAVKLLKKHLENSAQDFANEIQQGKMFGVLVVENQDGATGFLAAYSGQVLSKLESDYFVPAVFDYLDFDGYFKINERKISDINNEISKLENQILELKNLLENDEEIIRLTTEIEEYKNFVQLEKQKRKVLRQSVKLSDDENEQLIKNSQFQKAEIKRMRNALTAISECQRQKIIELEKEIQGQKNRRKELSETLQKWLFTNFEFRNILGEKKSLLDIFNDLNGKIPPSGSGECCAPKLLQYAFCQGLKPLAMAEFWWGNSPKQIVRKHLNFYPACNSKCQPILDFMLRGLSYPANPLEISENQQLEYLYEDNSLIIVNKPHGMLSVPGKSNRKSAYDIVNEKFGKVWICHRLDMATSGILIFAKTKNDYENIHTQFQNHTIKKRYVAILEATPENPKGKICLPLRPDINDRPRQMVDYQYGKLAITQYEIVETNGNKECRIHLFPHTGRTHQLRVHCAHQDGLNIPIKGDELYGQRADRLYLHAEKITFFHPQTGKKITFEKKADF